MKTNADKIKMPTVVTFRNPLRLGALQLKLDFVFDRAIVGLLNLWIPETDESGVTLMASKTEEKKTHFLVSLKWPEIVAGSIKVEVDQEFLVVTGQRKIMEAVESEEGGHRRGPEDFEHLILIPQGVDSSMIRAECSEDILQIWIPKCKRGFNPIGKGLDFLPSYARGSNAS